MRTMLKQIAAWLFKHPVGVVLAVVASFVFAVGVVIYVFLGALSFVYEAANPVNKGSAIFYSEVDFGGEPPLTVFVRDYSSSGRKPLFVDLVEASDQGAVFAGAVWSGDCSLLVVDVWHHRKWGPDQKVPRFGYDFQNHVKVKPEAISQLLTRRGGVGQQVVSDGYELAQLARRPYPWGFSTLSRP